MCSVLELFHYSDRPGLSLLTFYAVAEVGALLREAVGEEGFFAEEEGFGASSLGAVF